MNTRIDFLSIAMATSVPGQQCPTALCCRAHDSDNLHAISSNADTPWYQIGIEALSVQTLGVKKRGERLMT